MFGKLLSKLDKGQPFVWREFWLIDWNKRQYIRGNFVAFGLWSGFWSNLSLMCPLYNTIRYYGIRHMTLAFDDNLLVNAAIIRSLEDNDANKD